MNNSRDRYGLPQVRDAWGTPPPPVGRVGTGYRQAYRQALPAVRPGYRHTFSPAPAPVARVQTGYRVRAVNSDSVERFRRMLNDPRPRGSAFSKKLEQECDKMELWIEDYKKKRLEQQQKVDFFARIYMEDIPIFQQNAELKAENDALRLKMQQKDELKSESDAFKQNAELKSENQKLKLKIKEMRQSVEHDFECPISTSRFDVPVVAEDGHTYEASCITDWFLKGNKTSPLTQEILEAPNLVHNHTLRKVMTAFE